MNRLREYLSHQENRYLLLALACMATLLVFLYSVRISIAHEASRPELDDWFMGLHNKKNTPCCDGSDATRLSDVDWTTKDGHYQVRLENQWVDVPDDAVIDSPNKFGPTLVWPFYLNGELIGIRCFMPGTMT